MQGAVRDEPLARGLAKVCMEMSRVGQGLAVASLHYLGRWKEHYGQTYGDISKGVKESRNANFVGGFMLDTAGP